MIVDLQGFIKNERGYWQELEAVLERLDRDPASRLSLDEVRRFHYLYERVSADLGKIATFAVEGDTRRYLEVLVSRAYGEIHETRARPHRLRPVHWFLVAFPVTFRKHIRAFMLSAGVTVAGCLLGVLMISLDPSSKDTLMPFHHLLGDPSERVELEESRTSDHLRGVKAQGSAWYIKHNTGVAFLTAAMGMTWGVGTLVLLFSNGIMLGAVVADYVAAGETTFLTAWLLPHGSTEIPAILLAGQAGLVLAGALVGWGRRVPLRRRLREVSPDVIMLLFGVAVFLVWAGIVEACLSQYHAPVVPYGLKTALGVVELVLVVLLLARSGRRSRGGIT